MFKFALGGEKGDLGKSLGYNNDMRGFVPENAKLIPEEATCVFTGKIYDVYQWPQKMYDGSIETFEMLRRADTVKIIGVVTETEVKTLRNVGYESGAGDKIIITRQVQPRKDWFYDYPGGRVDMADKNELAAAKREMREETGLEFRNWKLVEVHQPFTKIDWLVYTFVATGLVRQQEQELDAGEKIEVLAATLEEINEFAKSEDSIYLRFKGFEKTQSIEEILAKPVLFNYE